MDDQILNLTGWASREEQQAEALERAWLKLRRYPAAGGSGDMTKAVYDTNSNNIVDLAENLSLPTYTLAGRPAAAVGWSGRMIIISQAGSDDRLQVCLKTQGGPYTWVTFAIAGS